MKRIYLYRINGCIGLKHYFMMFQFLLFYTLSIQNLSAQIVVGPTTTDSLKANSFVSIPYINSSGTNQLMIVGISAASITESISTVTYKGASFTKLGSHANTASGRVELWYLTNPGVGSFNVEVTSTGNDNAAIGVSTFIGVNLSSPFSNLSLIDGNSNTAGTTITSTTNDLVLSLVSFANNDNNLTLGSGQSGLWDFGVNGVVVGALSSKLGNTSVAVSSTSTQVSDWAMMAVSLNQNCSGTVLAPVFSLGGSSSRCQGVGDVTYTATATNSSSIK
jgi:hypothetical protein